ncbi:MAG: cytochrome c [Alphaproteobacteria bacterium]
MTKNIRHAAAATLLATVLAAGAAGAHGGAMGVVKERMDLMERLGDAMKAIAGMMKDPAAYDGGDLARHAEAIEAHGGDALTAVFPTDSREPPSEARAEIWTEWARFEGLARDLSAEARRLADLAASAPAPTPDVVAAFRATAETCGACHKAFRQKK